MAKKQGVLAGMERKSVKELDTAAEAYVDARDKRMKLTEKEADAKQALIEAMKKHNISIYRDEDVSPPLVVVVVPGKDNVKVTEAEDGEAESEIDTKAEA